MIMTTDMAHLQSRYEIDVFGKRGPTLVRGRGARVWDSEGREYIDCIAGQGSANLGHAHPRVVHAVQSQAETLITCPGAFANDVRARYMEKLVNAAPDNLERVFLCNSGTESVEAALKFARVSTGRNKIVAARGGFHGRTFGALSATFNPKYRKGCGTLLPDFQHVPFNKEAALEEAVDERTAAVILEVVQGEGGVHIAEPTFLQMARNLCDQHGALLIIDEVQTGFGRTGKLFAIEHHPTVPDILCLAKSIAGGMPMGAVLVNDQVKVPIGTHGSTFGGNPVACAAAIATLEALDHECLPEHAALMGQRLENQIIAAQLPVIRKFRRLGLMTGIELKINVRPVLRTLMDQGLLALAAGGTVLRLLPPLVISEDDLDFVAQTVIRVLEGV